MFRHTKLEYKFVHYIPEQLEPSVIYISMDYATAAHSCCCGCGEQVITPFAPADWKLTFDGESISLWPSIGNWNFPCRSHYIIRHGKVLAAEPWESKQIEGGRQRDHKRKKKHCEEKMTCKDRTAPSSQSDSASKHLGLWDRIRKIRKKRR